VGGPDQTSLLPGLGGVEDGAYDEECGSPSSRNPGYVAYEHEQKYVKPIVIEHKPDGSRAQELLGGTLQIKAPWVDNGDKN
jgi:hypothetical protein